jgi:hypothetical protein
LRAQAGIAAEKTLVMRWSTSHIDFPLGGVALYFAYREASLTGRVNRYIKLFADQSKANTYPVAIDQQRKFASFFARRYWRILITIFLLGDHRKKYPVSFQKRGYAPNK